MGAEQDGYAVTYTAYTALLGSLVQAEAIVGWTETGI